MLMIILVRLTLICGGGFSFEFSVSTIIQSKICFGLINIYCKRIVLVTLPYIIFFEKNENDSILTLL